MWRLIFVLLFAIGAVAQTANTPQLTFITKTLPGAMVGHSYTQQIQIQGGKGPFKWSIGEGYLPPGVDLQTNTGLLSGQPSVKGYFRFVVEVQDLATHATAKSEFAINVSGPLLLEWIDPPKLSDNTISGRIKVTNSGTQGDSFDLTVIIVAVNEVGKAFALGYQHFDLAQDIEQVIPFSSTLPNGAYIVHVDAVAEVPARDLIFRARLQTPTPLIVNVNR